MHKIRALKRKADEDEGRAKKKGKRGGKSKKEKKKAKTEEKHKQGRKEGEKTKEETENEEEDTESEEEDSPFLKLYNDRRSGIKNSIVWVVSREQRQPEQRSERERRGSEGKDWKQGSGQSRMTQTNQSMDMNDEEVLKNAENDKSEECLSFLVANNEGGVWKPEQTPGRGRSGSQGGTSKQSTHQSRMTQENQGMVLTDERIFETSENAKGEECFSILAAKNGKGVQLSDDTFSDHTQCGTIPSIDGIWEGHEGIFYLYLTPLKV